MKTIITVIWNWLKKVIKINIDIDVYIYINGKWVKNEIWQLKENIEKHKLGIDTGIKKVRYVKKGRDIFDKKAKDEDFKEIVKRSQKH